MASDPNRPGNRKETLRTPGRTMTLPQGCRKQGRDLAGVVRALTKEAFTEEGAA